MSRMVSALVVEDEPDLRERLVRHLHRAGVVDEIVEAWTGRDCMELLREREFAVVVLDLGLPDADGLDLLPEMLALDPSARVVCLTGRDEARSAVRALEAGAAAYLVKPWSIDELEVHVRRAVARYREVSVVDLARRTAAAAPGLAAGRSPEWTRVLELARDAGGSSRATVLVRGESGTGKEVVASLIHRLSARASGPFVTTNVASIPAGLLESELFGHEPGAYTGASGTRRGLFELADHGTIFLDEIGELPLELQPRLLRILEGQPFRRLGGEREVHVDVRIVAATHRNLEVMVANGELRADLLYRLKVLEISIPPLRERRQDVEVLAIHFLSRLAAEEHGRDLSISREALSLLAAHDWPGNVRELRNAIERAAVLSRGGRIEARHLPTEIAARPMRVEVVSPVGDGRDLAVDDPADDRRPLDDDLRLEGAIRRHIERVWALTGGNLSQTARALDMSRVALRRRLRTYGLLSAGEEISVVTDEPLVTNRPRDPSVRGEGGPAVTSPNR